MSQRPTTLGAQAVYPPINRQRPTTLGVQVIYSRQPRPPVIPPGSGASGGSLGPSRGGAVYLDSYLEYDGRHVGTDDGLYPLAYLTLSGGTTWLSGEAVTITASRSVFVGGDVGNVIILHGEDGTTIRIDLTAYTSATVMTGTPSVAIPTAMREVPILIWDKAIDTVAGLEHLEGQNVGILADNHVIASPNNARLPIVTVTGGQVDLGDFYTHVYVGLPYFSDLETLDIDRPSGASLKGTRMAITHVGLMVEKSRAMWVGGQPPTNDAIDPLEALTELPAFGDDGYETLTNEYEEVNVELTRWNNNGRVFVRVVDPTPATVLAALPTGFIPSSQ